MEERSADIAIVGAGIVGLAHAYMALRHGYKVVLFEREQFAVGASVRNFGLLWPIGQAPGVGLDRALRAKKHWDDVSSQAGFWIKQNGSLHVAYHEDEWQVLQEFYSIYKDAGYKINLLDVGEVVAKSPRTNTNGLRGGLWSSSEGTVYAREAIRRIPLWLKEKFGLQLRFGHVVKEISLPKVTTSREQWFVDRVIVCSGADFETLYPQIYEQHNVTKCKLQMMRAIPESPFELGPTLCAGLTLRHYQAFAQCRSLNALDQRYDREQPDYKKHGIHVLLAQNQAGDLIIGDSHHYSKTVEPFDDESVNELVLAYLKTFTDLGKMKIVERWHGVYPKVAGGTDLIVEPEPGVTIVNGLGGAGMTLSFGIAEDVISRF